MRANSLVSYIIDIIKFNYFSNDKRVHTNDTESEIVAVINKYYNNLITQLKANEYTYKHININGRDMFDIELQDIAGLVYNKYYVDKC